MATNCGVDSPLDLTTGTGKFVGSASPTFTGTPILSTPTATSLTFTSTAGIIGATTNNSATAGSVGEYISSAIVSGSAVSLTSTVSANVTSISLTAGDWDVRGNVFLTASVGASEGYGWVSATTATLPDLSLVTGSTPAGGQPFVNNGASVPTQRFSLASTTTIYLSAQATFGSGTCSACGFIGARRVR